MGAHEDDAHVVSEQRPRGEKSSYPLTSAPLAWAAALLHARPVTHGAGMPRLYWLCSVRMRLYSVLLDILLASKVTELEIGMVGAGFATAMQSQAHTVQTAQTLQAWFLVRTLLRMPPPSMLPHLNLLMSGPKPPQPRLLHAAAEPERVQGHRQWPGPQHHAQAPQLRGLPYGRRRAGGT